MRPPLTPERRWLSVVAALAALGMSVGLGLSWLAVDERPGQGLCCELVPELRAFSAAVGGDGPGWRSTSGWAQGLGWLGLRLWGLDGPLLAMLGSVALLQLGQLLAARRLGGPGAGLLAAALAPMVPLIALAQRRFDVFAPQLALVSAALVALLCSRGLTRPLGALAFGALTLATLTSSPHPTDNYLALVALAGMAAGSLGRALWLGVDDQGEAIDRRRSAAVGAALVAAVVVMLPIAPSLGDGGGLLGVSYYLDEAGQLGSGAGLPREDPRALAAYAMHTFWRGFGPALGAPLLLGAALWLWRGRGRAEVLGAILPLGLALSLLAKKNVYYLAPAWPALALLPALGVAALPAGPKGALRWGAAAALLGLGGAQLAARAFPHTAAGAALSGRFEPPYDDTLYGAFQTSDQDMSLAPRPAPPGAALAALTAELLPETSCGCGWTAVTVGGLVMDAWWLRAVARDPCLRTRNPPIGEGTEDIGVALVSAELRPGNPQEDHQRRELLAWASASLTRVEGADGVAVWARDPAWFARRCGPQR